MKGAPNLEDSAESTAVQLLDDLETLRYVRDTAADVPFVAIWTMTRARPRGPALFLPFLFPCPVVLPAPTVTSPAMLPAAVAIAIIFAFACASRTIISPPMARRPVAAVPPTAPPLPRMLPSVPVLYDTPGVPRPDTRQCHLRQGQH